MGSNNKFYDNSNGITKIANNIYYNSYEGGSAFSTWSDEEQLTADLTLSRGDAVKPLTITKDEKIVTLTNPLTGSNYIYKIKCYIK